MENYLGDYQTTLDPINVYEAKKCEIGFGICAPQENVYPAKGIFPGYVYCRRNQFHNYLAIDN